MSEFVFHETHNHWHIVDVARYEVRTARDDGTGGRFGTVFKNDAGPQDFTVDRGAQGIADSSKEP